MSRPAPPEIRRAYRRQHPLAIALSFGIAFAGLAILLFPDSVEQSSTYLALPAAVRAIFNLCYAGGGMVALYGLLRADPRFEGAGMSLLSAVLAVQWVSIIYITHWASFISAFFLLVLAIGCGYRAWLLARGLQ